MAGPAPTETEGKLSTRGEITPQAVNPVVTTDGQHAEAVAEIAKNVREAGFTNPQVSPTAEADQVLAQIQKDTPGVNVVDIVAARADREAGNLWGQVVGTENKYLAKPDRGIHLVPIQRVAKKAKSGLMGAITNHFFQFKGKKAA